MIYGACLGGKVERCVGESKLGSDNTDEWECGKIHGLEEKSGI